MNEKNNKVDSGPGAHRFSVAPMLDRTDRHCRHLLRLISRHTRLYSEMITTGALLKGDAARLLEFGESEHPVALQLGGSDPVDLAACARLGSAHGYDEINLNLGCPSSRVQSGRFGACMMAEPERVADCIASMCDAVDIPVTAKIRIGIDADDSYAGLAAYVGKLSDAGCHTFIVHARIAILGGLSPKENRNIPPLKYPTVYRLKEDFPELEIVLNGGVNSLEDALQHLEKVDGVMVGRAAYQNPYLLAEVDRKIFSDARPISSRREIAEQMISYIENELSRGTRIKHITRHMSGLFQGVAGARHWRKHLSTHSHLPDAGIHVINEALNKIGRFQSDGVCKET